MIRATPRMSAARFEEVASSLGPCELVKGEVIPMSPGGVEHSRVVVRIVALLWTWAQKSGLGQVLSGEAGIIVEEDPDTVRGADVAFISYKRFPKGQKWAGFLRQKPELVVEVLGSKDTWEALEAKVAQYHAFGVDLVWIADPQTQTVRVHPRRGKSVALHGSTELSGGKLLPGFNCSVDDVFKV